MSSRQNKARGRFQLVRKFEPGPFNSVFTTPNQALQRQIKAIGGRWDAGKKLWFAPEEYVKRLGLMKRIVR